MGSLRSYLADIARSTGRELKVDIISYRASITTADPAVITYAAPSPGNIRRLLKDWSYYMVELRASSTTAADLDDLDQIRFNLQLTGETETLFSTDVEMSALWGPQSGEPMPIRFDPGGRKMGGGRDLELTVTARAAITTARVVVVQLICLLVPDSFA